MPIRDEQGHRVSARQRNDDELREIRGKALRSWTELTETVQMPLPVAAAFATGRPELLALVEPQEYNAEQVGHLIHLIKVLLETNMALQQHASNLAKLADQLDGHMVGLRKMTIALEHYANFRASDETDEEDE